MADPNACITICTTTCPIPSQPSTWIIDEVYRSVRAHLPTAKYLFLFDGVHEIQESLRAGYEEYRATLTQRIDAGKWENCKYAIFPEWHHQAGMIRAVLAHNEITTPLVLWLEHDFPFNGLLIDWPQIADSLIENEICYLRFALPEENQTTIRAMHWPITSRFGVPMWQTRNYSSLPHVCRLDFLRRLVTEFVEAKSHLECEATEGIGYREEQWRLALYTPPGEIARFYSLDGRLGHQKPKAVL